jgi:hypothetical protein
LGRPLGRGDEGHRNRAAKPGDRVSVAHRVGCLVGEFRVLVHDDHKRGHVRGWFPYTAAGRGQVRGAALQDGNRVGEQCGGLLGRGGQPVDALAPWLEFHPVLEVDRPDDHVVAGGKGGHEHIESAALAGPGRAGEQRVPM